MLYYDLTDGMTSDEIEYVETQLRAYNLSAAPLPTPPSINVNFAAKTKDGLQVGGLIGKIYRGCLFVDMLWVHEDHRGQGLGEWLLDKAEKTACDHRCRFIHLDTFSFQAPEFYKKNGFVVFGVLEGYTDDIKRYYLKKEL